MKVIEPASYEIEFTDEEEKTITDCVTLLEKIYSTMEKHQCTNLVDSTSDEVITDYTIVKMAQALNSLPLMNVME